MKKLMTGLVVLMMLSICASSFGYILVYNVSASVKGADDDTDLKTTVPLKGYMIINLDNTTSELVDANLILYGKDANTPTKQKVYVELNYSDIADLLGMDIWTIGDFLFVDFWGRSPFDFEAIVSGTMKTKTVGPLVTPTLQDVASSLKGSMLVWDGFLLGPADQDVSGVSSSVSATLNNSATKWANGDNDEDEVKTQDQVVDEALDILDFKGFDAATLP
jgi:hypothetical protein